MSGKIEPKPVVGVQAILTDKITIGLVEFSVVWILYYINMEAVIC